VSIESGRMMPAIVRIRSSTPEKVSACGGGRSPARAFRLRGSSVLSGGYSDFEALFLGAGPPVQED
jgi:hypothetical protein